MTTSKPFTSEQQIAIIKQLYAGLNRNDPDAVIKLMDPGVTRTEFEGTPNTGTYRGLAAMQEHLAAGRSTWAEGSCEPIAFTVRGDKIIVTVHVKVRLKQETTWIDAQTTDGFSFRENRVAEFHSFVSQEKALEWAGTF